MSIDATWVEYDHPKSRLFQANSRFIMSLTHFFLFIFLFLFFLLYQILKMENTWKSVSFLAVNQYKFEDKHKSLIIPIAILQDC